jgi:uncharacterized protein (TIGR03905 family)
MQYKYKTNGVCASEIIIDVEDGIVNDVKFVGGCSGNTQGVGALVKGMKVEEVISRLRGIDCRGRGTSCPDQLAKALTEVSK